MLSRTLTKNLFQRASPLTSVASRGVYTDETRPYVFINEHTKVICQGMTGKHVSLTHLSDSHIWKLHLTINHFMHALANPFAPFLLQAIWRHIIASGHAK